MVQPPTILRLAVTAGLFLPLIKNFWMAPAVIILFAGLRFNSIAPFGYVPQSWDIYEYLILIIAVLHVFIYKNKRILKFSRSQIFLFIFMFMVDLINMQPFSKIFLFILMLFLLYNSIQDRKSLNLVILSFIILTITLSIYYFVFAKEFMVSYSFDSHSERSTWVDPNYFGLLLGCGVILSSGYIYRSVNIKISIIYKVIFITCITLGFIVIALQASRGAMLAVSIAFIIQLLLSQAKPYMKIIFLLVTIVVVTYLFQSEYFNLLIERVENEGTDTSRFKIWLSKLSEWSENIFNYLGTGFYSSVTKFRPYNYDCHNEYVSIIINYGIIGISIFVSHIYKLLKERRNRTFIYSITCFILTTFMTLSPLTQQTGWIASPFLILLLYKFIALDKVESCTVRK
jgi:hypothetical protein